MNTEDMLRTALEAEANTVEVAPDALDRIRARTTRHRGWRRLRLGSPALPGGLALVGGAIVLAILVGTGSCRPATHSAPVPPAGSAPARSSAPAPSSAAPVQTANLPVYYLGATSQGLRLYREFHPLPLTDSSPAGRATAAVGEMLRAGGALDPDYTGYWPAGSGVGHVSVADGVVTVDLTGAAHGRTSDPATVRLSLQQLVWTATAASGTTGLRLLLDGTPAGTLWGVVPAGGVLSRAAAVDVLGPVWVIDPQQGATVSRTFTVHLAGVVFEATARLRVRSAAGTVVSDQSVHLSAGSPAQGEATVTLTLAPGGYTIEGYFVSLKDGSEQGLDGHQITVR
jgi:hypothetical protein